MRKNDVGCEKKMGQEERWWKGIYRKRIKTEVEDKEGVESRDEKEKFKGNKSGWE